MPAIASTARAISICKLVFLPESPKAAFKKGEKIVSFIQLMWASYGFGFGRNLRQLRLARGLSQQALADMSKVSRNQISNLERADATAVADPAMSTVYKLALALEIPPAVLLPAGGDVVEGHLADSAVLGVEDVAPFPQDYINQRRFSNARG